MSLDTIPIEILTLVLSHIPPTPCTNHFSYDFPITNNKPLKPHRVYYPVTMNLQCNNGGFDFYKYQIYSPYISFRDVLELCLVCKQLKDNVFAIVFQKCITHSQEFYKKVKHDIFKPKTALDSYSFYSPSRKKPRHTSLNLNVFLDNSIWDNDKHGYWVASRIPISAAVNPAVTRVLRDFTLTIGTDSVGMYKRFSMAESIIKILNHTVTPNLINLTLIVASQSFWTEKLAIILAGNLNQYNQAYNRYPYLSIYINCARPEKILKSCLNNLKQYARRLSLNQKIYHPDLDIDIIGPNPAASNLKWIVLDMIPQFPNLNTLEFEVERDDNYSSVGTRFISLKKAFFLKEIITPFREKLKDMPNLTTLSFSSCNPIRLPLWIQSAPSTLKALVVDCNMFYGNSPLQSSSTHFDHVYEYTKLIDKSFPGLQQLYFYNAYSLPDEFIAPHLTSLAISCATNTSGSFEVLEKWNRFFSRNCQNLRRLCLQNEYISFEMLDIFFRHSPLLIQLEIPLFSRSGQQCSGDNLLIYLKNHQPQFCRQVEILTLILQTKIFSFQILHGITKWLVKDSEAFQLGNYKADRLGTPTSGYEKLFSSLKRMSFRILQRNKVDEVFTNGFLSDYQDYYKPEFPYLFKQVSFTMQTPWKIFREDSVSYKLRKQESPNYITGDMLQKLAHIRNRYQQDFEYELHLELLEDIQVIPINRYPGPQISQNYVFRDPDLKLPEQYQQMRNSNSKSNNSSQYRSNDSPKYFIQTSKKWY